MCGTPHTCISIVHIACTDDVACCIMLHVACCIVLHVACCEGLASYILYAACISCRLLLPKECASEKDVIPSSPVHRRPVASQARYMVCHTAWNVICAWHRTRKNIDGTQHIINPHLRASSHSGNFQPCCLAATTGHQPRWPLCASSASNVVRRIACRNGMLHVASHVASSRVVPP